ncbi:MAG: HAD-IA family hydrolase, partial [Acidimicrobiia bacterium]|nr:HAD-IA family hydrolase [Acidimicrobiia bacterium]
HYLDAAVFHTERAFSKDDFIGFMKEQSQPIPGSLELLTELASRRGPTLATLNNESRELNEYRIERFGLRDSFSLFLSSCYLGVKKPDDAIYRTAVDITQHRIDESVFIDDRPLNLECSRLLGISSVLFESPEQLRGEMESRGLL